mgnify:CR=1 FL=1
MSKKFLIIGILIIAFSVGIFGFHLKFDAPFSATAQTSRPAGSLLQPDDVTSSHIRDGTIVNVDVSGSAAIHGGKILLESIPVDRLQSTTSLPFNRGGTATTTWTSGVVTNDGTKFSVVAPGTNANVLTSNGTIWESKAVTSSGFYSADNFYVATSSISRGNVLTTGSGGAGTSDTFVFSVNNASSSPTVLMVGVTTFGNVAINSITYDGVNMTPIGPMFNTSGTNFANIYYLGNPHKGSNNLVLTYASAVTARATVVNYIDATATNFINGTSTKAVTASTSVMTLTTTTRPNAWIFTTCHNAAGGNMTADTNATLLGTDAATAPAFDTNGLKDGVATAGATPMNATHASGSTGCVSAGIMPAYKILWRP